MDAIVVALNVNNVVLGYAMTLHGTILETWYAPQGVSDMDLLALKYEAESYCDLYNCLPPPDALTTNNNNRFSVIKGGRN